MEQNTTNDVQTVALTAQTQANILTDTITLKAREIYAQMSQFGQEPKNYKETSSMKGEQFYTFKCKGAMINVPIDFQSAFVSRKLYSLTITGRPYNRVTADPTAAGGSRTTIEQSWSYDSHETIENYKATMKADAEILKLEAAIDIQNQEVAAVAKAAKNVKITPEREKILMSELTSLLAADPEEVEEELEDLES